MDNKEKAKIKAAEAALSYICQDQVLGVGTGSTVSLFIELLAKKKVLPEAIVPTSRQSETQLLKAGFEVVTIDKVTELLPVYVDGADAIDGFGQALKGGGGAHVVEKQVAALSKIWVCIIDESKLINDWQGKNTVSLEITPSEYEAAKYEIATLGGVLVKRSKVISDSGNLLADIHGLDLTMDLCTLENKLEKIPGVQGCGIFAKRRADIILVGRLDATVLTINPR